MKYSMRQSILERHCLSDNAEDEKYIVEDMTNNVFHKWDDKLEVFFRICDYYSYIWRFYNDGRVVMQMIFENTADSETEWRGYSDEHHLEYETIDVMLLDWHGKLSADSSKDFEEEINFIESLVR